VVRRPARLDRGARFASGPGDRTAMAMKAQARLPPICVELDRTLIRTDSLFESLMALLKHHPLSALSLPGWLLQGKAVLKAQIARDANLNPAALPYNQEALAWLRSERQAGRSIWLCTAADQRIAASIADHLQLFEGVLASDGKTDFAGAAKAEGLVAKFGSGGFDYCGSGRRDAEVWSRSRAGVLVDPSHPVAAGAETGRIVKTISSTSHGLSAVLRLLRPHQWAKNALLLVPLLAAHGQGGAGALPNALLALVAFCLCASSVYVLNDLLDLEADRAHPRKSKRPLAAGEVSLGTALILAPILLAGAAVIAAFLPPRFQVLLGLYYGLTSAYTFVLKGKVLVDAICLAGLYTLRIIAGAAAALVPLSFWLLLFSVFLFLSLAFVKRYAELDALRRQQRLTAVGRGYHVEDLPLLQSMGGAAGYLSVLVLALYINSPAIESLYHRPKYIWLLCVLMLYWISRVWMKAHRGTLHDDPVVFALKDRQSLAIGLLAAVTVVLAI
jgi:4-hydroxybenzoate polyprenyltransferase